MIQSAAVTEPPIELVELAGGLRVLWLPSPGPTTARLLFRVGVLDETLPTRGWTHLVEHLAHAEVGFPIYAANATTGDLFTAFDVSGTLEEVSAHLAAVCRALRDLPVDDLDREVGVLARESDRRGASDLALLRRTRHGWTGSGLLSTRELGLHRVGAEDVRAWSARAFTTGAAVCWITGPVRPDLALALAPGPPLPVPAVTSVLDDVPAWCSGPADAVALTAVVTHTPAVRAAWWWLHRQLRQRLRGVDGDVYDVEAGIRELGTGQVELWLTTSTTTDRAGAVLEAVRAVLDGVWNDPVPQEDLAAWLRQGSPAGLADPRQRLDAAARSLLLTGDPGADEEWAARSAVLTPADVRAAAVEALGTALLQVPEGVDAPAGLAPARPRPTTTVDGGTAFVPARHAPAAGRLLVGPEGVLVEPAPAVLSSVAWSDCVAVLRRADGRRDVIGRDGTSAGVDPDDWSRGAEAVAALDAATPPGLAIDLPDEDPRPVEPRPLSGLAASSTSVLVLLVVVMALFTAAVAGAIVSTDGFTTPALSVTVVGSVLTVALTAPLVRRLRAPRELRRRGTPMSRSRSSVALDQALARGSASSNRAVAAGAWVVTLLAVLFCAVHRVSPLPAGLPAVIAVRATREVARRRHR